MIHDMSHFGLSRKMIRKEFQQLLGVIRSQVYREFGRQTTEEHLRTRLIFVNEARRLAIAEINQFERELDQLERDEPALRKRVGGISSIGDEREYINWI